DPVAEPVPPRPEPASPATGTALKPAAPRVEPPPRLWWGLLAAVAGGLALAGAFAPARVLPLAPPGPALLGLALWRRRARGAFGLGALFGLAFFTPLLSWLINVAWYAWGALALAESLVFGLLCVGQLLLLRWRAWPLTVATWWVAAEALRDRWPYA